MDSDLIHTGGSWDKRIDELQALLIGLRPQLIDAEAELAERLAAISAFEYRSARRRPRRNRVRRRRRPPQVGAVRGRGS